MAGGGKKRKEKGEVSMGRVESDGRFDFTKDPRFRKLQLKERKISLDKRFSRVLKNKDFSVTAVSDPYSRLGRHKKAFRGKHGKGRTKFIDVETDDMSKYYRLSLSDESNEESADGSGSDNDVGKNSNNEDNENNESMDDNSISTEQNKLICDMETHNRKSVSSTHATASDTEELSGEDWPVKRASAEGGGVCVTGISGGTESNNSDGPATVWDTVWDTTDIRVPMGDGSRRLAVLGCIWDSVSANDVFALFYTYMKGLSTSKRFDTNTKGTSVGMADKLKSAAVFLSNFGASKIEEEMRRGPSLWNTKNTTAAGLLDTPAAGKGVSDYTSENADGMGGVGEVVGQSFGGRGNTSDAGDEDDEDDEETEQMNIRLYQKQRAKYYFAILEFQDEDTASLVYDEMDGIEMDFFVDTIDLRFLPEDLELPRAPTAICSSFPVNYKPPETFQSAMRHSKVTVTWDQTRPERTKVLTKRFKAKELAELDIKDYLASSSAMSDEDDNNSEAGDTFYSVNSNDDSDGGKNEPDSNDEPKNIVNIEEGQKEAGSGAKLGDDCEDAVEGFDSTRRSISQYRRSLLGGGEMGDSSGNESEHAEGSKKGNGSKKDIEIKFYPSLQTLSCEIQKKVQEIDVVGGKLGGPYELTPWEQIVKKERSRRKERKVERRKKAREDTESRERQELSSNVASKSKKFPLVGQQAIVTPLFADESQNDAKVSVGSLPIDLDDVADHFAEEEDHHVEMNRKRIKKELRDTVRGMSRRKKLKVLAAAQKRGEEFEANVDDPRFSKLVTDENFFIDPTNPGFKDTQSSRHLMRQIRNRKTTPTTTFS